jgi:hypothetical protein
MSNMRRGQKDNSPIAGPGKVHTQAAHGARCKHCSPDSAAGWPNPAMSRARTVAVEYRFAEGGFDRLPPSYRLLARDCGPHRDAGQIRWVILDLGELPCLIEFTKLNPGPSGEDAERGRSTSRCRITLR